ncbi:unnamed protein product [Notodromas monacha]|uniref:Uncharacterized protein n=1 Tax=Notodromas monacha TaxID=399045 RepID=A0A7R9BFU6_9CRUS|nr:unnamed protein product [Notodromas monacha]CAG0914492.1 unnamed protein product [Notodromas monacha]
MDPYPYEYPVAYAAVPTYAGYHYYVVETVAVPPMKKPPRNFSAYDFFFGCFRGSTGNPFEDAISETNPRVIDDARARKLAADLKKCTYYETCATYGLNVEKVFQDACQKIVQHRMMLGSIPRSSTPNHFATASRSAVWGCPGTPTPYLPSPTHGGPPALIMSPHASTATAFGPPPPQTYHAMPPPAAGPLPQFLKCECKTSGVRPQARINKPSTANDAWTWWWANDVHSLSLSCNSHCTALHCGVCRKNLRQETILLTKAGERKTAARILEALGFQSRDCLGSPTIRVTRTANLVGWGLGEAKDYPGWLLDRPAEKNKGVVLVPGGGGGMERATSSVGGVCLFPTRYSSGTQQQQQQQVQQQQQQHCVSGGENNSSGGEKSGKTFSDDRRMMPPPLPTTTTTSSSCIDQFPTPSSTPTTSRVNMDDLVSTFNASVVVDDEKDSKDQSQRCDVRLWLDVHFLLLNATAGLERLASMTAEDEQRELEAAAEGDEVDKNKAGENEEASTLTTSPALAHRLRRPLPPAYVVNLERRPERRRRVGKSLELLGMRTTFVPAVDGRLVSDDWLQHRGIRKLREILAEAEALAPHWDLIYLARKHLPGTWDPEPAFPTARYLHTAPYSYWAVAYVVSTRGAEKLLRPGLLKNLLPTDEYLPLMFDQHPVQAWKDKFPERDLEAYVVEPSVAEPVFYPGDSDYVSDTEDSTLMMLSTMSGGGLVRIAGTSDDWNTTTFTFDLMRGSYSQSTTTTEASSRDFVVVGGAAAGTVMQPRASVVERNSSSIFTSDESANVRFKDGGLLPVPSSSSSSSSSVMGSNRDELKNRRRSNLFTPSSKKEEAEKKAKNGELGVGRAIPVKQGHLYKRSSKTLNKEWKKKYVTLCDDGRLTYHPSLQDYMDDVHGKEIDLQCTTVKYAGQHRPRVPATNGVLDMSHLSISDRNCDTENSIVISSLTVSGMDSLGSTSAMPVATASASAMCTPSSSSSKKRHRRLKTSISRSKHSHHHDDGDDSDGYEFFIVSKDSKTWHFEAANAEERDEWVQAIEQCILTSLQGNESFKGKNSGAAKVNMDPSAIVSLRKAVDGNLNCCDCDAPNPDWASLNLGTLICIECSGIHRNLGSHISRVRSLGLDEWPPGPLAVMMALGNRVANSVWEGAMRQLQRPGPARPTPTTPREEKERWIRWKYEEKRFLAPLSNPAGIGQQLIDAVCRGDVKHVSLLLAHSKPEHVSVTVSSRDLRTPLHIACSMGNLPIVQLLLWNQAQVVPRDHDGLTCLEHAHCSGNANVEELVAQYCAASGSGSMLQSQANGAGTHLLQHSPSSAPGPGGNSSFSLSSSGGAGPSTALTCSPSTPQQHQQQQHQMHSPAGGAQARSLFSGRSSVMRCQEGSKGPNGLDPFEKVPSSVI